jgi:HTH-type transcriptional regulator / antitoxin HigA
MIEVLNPRDVIREELEDRHWTQDDLAEIMGRQTSYINRILSGNVGISPRTAKELGAAFGTGAMFWMALESAYKLSKVKAK